MNEPDWTLLSSFLDAICNPAHPLHHLFDDDLEREAAVVDAVRSGEALVRARRSWNAGTALPPRLMPRGELNAATKISFDRDELETLTAAGGKRYFAAQVIPAEVERWLHDKFTPTARVGPPRAHEERRPPAEAACCGWLRTLPEHPVLTKKEAFAKYNARPAGRSEPISRRVFLRAWKVGAPASWRLRGRRPDAR